MKPSTVAVVLCAGQGRRMGVAHNKVFLPLGGVPLLARTLAAFERATAVDEVLLVAHPDELAACRALADEYSMRKVAAVIPGGVTRHQSEEAALGALRQRIAVGQLDLVLIQDGARPFVTPAEVDAVCAMARESGGALLAAPVAAHEVIARLDDAGSVEEILPPDALWRAQTPQAFAARELLRAYDVARADGFEGTDTAASYERRGHPVSIVEGSADNFKITTSDDLLRAEAFLARHVAP
jgi:2-C-methyl-D-erythritol 4-phosphate cytidylyltransferase